MLRYELKEKWVTNINKPFVISFFNQKSPHIYQYNMSMCVSSKYADVSDIKFSVRGKLLNSNAMCIYFIIWKEGISICLVSITPTILSSSLLLPSSHIHSLLLPLLLLCTAKSFWFQKTWIFMSSTVDMTLPEKFHKFPFFSSYTHIYLYVFCKAHLSKHYLTYMRIFPCFPFSFLIFIFFIL